MAYSPNFNVYDVLEPLKCQLKPSEDSNVGILIDINDDTDICKNLSGSDLDNIKKSEFDLVDLYQNIYVTPQHVKKQNVRAEEDMYCSFNVKCNLRDEFHPMENKVHTHVHLTEADIDELLNGTYEVTNESTSIETFSNYSHAEETNNGSHNNDNTTVNKKAINTGTTENSLSTSYVATQEKYDWIRSGERNSVSKPEIIEFLNNAQVNSTTNTIFNNKELREKLDWIKSRKDLKEALINELNSSDTKDSTKIHDHNIGVIKPPIDILKAVNNQERKKDSQSNITNNKVIKGIKTTLNNIDHVNKSLNTNLEMPSTSKTGMQYASNVNNTLRENIELLRTAKLDKKAYAKRNIKSDLEKIGYTIGPTLYEKSVVLPQILNKLAVRKEALIEEKNLKRRLLLDFGKPSKFYQCSPKPDTESSAVPTPKSRRETSSSHDKSAMKTVESEKKSSQNNAVTLNPIIAMENCNRERLLAHRVRSAFEKYILTGSYY